MCLCSINFISVSDFVVTLQYCVHFIFRLKLFSSLFSFHLFFVILPLNYFAKFSVYLYIVEPNIIIMLNTFTTWGWGEQGGPRAAESNIM